MKVVFKASRQIQERMTGAGVARLAGGVDQSVRQHEAMGVHMKVYIVNFERALSPFLGSSPTLTTPY